MKIALIALCTLAVAAAAPSTKDMRSLPALQHEEIHDAMGQYALRFVTAEGTVVSERGRLLPTPDGKAYVLVKEGETSFIGTDGKTYVTKYNAGLDGYHAEGAHLPVPPKPID